MGQWRSGLGFGFIWLRAKHMWALAQPGDSFQLSLFWVRNGGEMQTKTSFSLAKLLKSKNLSFLLCGLALHLKNKNPSNEIYLTI